MRTVECDFLGKPRVLCFSTRVYVNAQETFGGIEEMFAELGGKNSLKTTFWLFAQLTKAGAVYVKKTEGREVEPLTEDELLDLCDTDEAAKIAPLLTEAVMNGAKRTQEAEPQKKTEATPPGR